MWKYLRAFENESMSRTGLQGSCSAFHVLLLLFNSLCIQIRGENPLTGGMTITKGGLSWKAFSQFIIHMNSLKSHTIVLDYGPTFTIMDTVCRAPLARCSIWALPSSLWIIFFLLVLLRTMNHPFKSTITSLVRVIILVYFPPLHSTYLREIFSSSRWANFL